MIDNRGDALDDARRFGCDRCWPDGADAAWEARGHLRHAAELVDQSHLHAMLLECRDCTQRFLSVFTEQIDWVDGEDPQYWTLVPVTGSEAAELARQEPSEAALNAVGAGRRSLRHDFPKDADPRTYWDVGMHVGPHD